MFENIKKTQKFALEDEKYIRERKKFSEHIGVPDLFSIIDQFGLYAGSQTIANKLTVYELLKETLDIPGDVFEFGCWHGSNLMFMAKVLNLFRPNSHKRVFGFDGFEGLQTFAEKDEQDIKSMQGAYLGNEEILRKAILLFGMESWVHLIKGDAQVTIPKFDAEFQHTLVSFAYIDFDLYEPCKVALAFLASRLSPGGIVAFDEALLDFWPGEGIALREFIEDWVHAKFTFHSSPIARQPTLWLKRQ